MSGIAVEHLTVRIGDRTVLDDVSFDVPSGDLLTIVGPSGSGKSTLFRTILGEIEPDRGRVLVEGQDVTDRRLHERGVGTVYQSYALFPHMTVAENVGYALAVRRVASKERARKVGAMLELVRLQGMGAKYPHELSGGEKQRVAVARALMVKPWVLLLDEAFTALDATTRHQVVGEVRQIIKQVGLTTLLITHDQEEAFLFAQRVLILNEGRVVTIGRPEEVMAHPHPFIQDFVKMVMFRTARVERDAEGKAYVVLDQATRIPVHLPGMDVRGEVQVMIKKGPEGSEGDRVRVSRG